MTDREEAERLMRRALALAQRAAELGETPVGAVVIRAGEVVGEGQERTRARLDPSAHAEVEAISAACRQRRTLDLSDCTLYTTVEPCVLCGYAIRRSGVSLVVYGVPAGQAGAVTSTYAILTDGNLHGWPQPPIIVSGVLASECLEVLGRRITGPRIRPNSD
jgi:tRNA(adenine34) deaminase